MSEAYTSGTAPLAVNPTRVIEVKILTALRNGGGGGGGGGGAPDSINYPGPPALNPPDVAYIVVDSNYRQWQYGPSGWQ